jgi:hypothetical protein
VIYISIYIIIIKWASLPPGDFIARLANSAP